MKEFYKLLLTIFAAIGFLTAHSQHVPTKIFDIEKSRAAVRMNAKSAPQTADYDVHYYEINIDLNPSVRFVDGNVNIHFRVTANNMDSIVLDFGNQLVVDSIVYRQNTYFNANTNGFNTLSFTFPNSISVNTFDSVQVFYRGTPTGSPVGTPFAQVNVTGGNLIWTLSEPYGAKDWWPCKNALTDKADSISLNISVPQDNKVASIGLLLGIDTVGTTATYHWKTTYPTVAYLVAIGAGKYDFYQDQLYLNGDSILMEHYLFQNESRAQSLLGVEDFMVFFDSLFGAYPFAEEKYGHASFTFGGGMEHQTMSFMGNYGGGLKAHELVHQWFGNKITCGSWSDLWLNESFATYLTGITYEFGVVHSQSFWQVWLNGAMASGFSFPDGSVYRFGNDTLNVSSLFNNQVYNKGAVTLHTLRWKIGDSAFFAGVRNYMNDPNLVYGFAKTPDIKAHLEASSGQNLTEFFNDWIYGLGYPQIHTSWGSSGNNFTLNVTQVPSNSSVSLFEIPVPYRLIGNNIDTIIIVEPTTNYQTFNFKNIPNITSVEFNPDNRIFAKELFTVDISDVPNLKNLVVYPNPTSDFLLFDSELELRSAEVRIYNVNGQLLLSQPELNRILDVRSLSGGTYFLELLIDDEIIRSKFLKLD